MMRPFWGSTWLHMVPWG